MVLAAGLGTRFRPVTETMPKPLVPLCNRPLVGWAIDSLITAGVSEVVVNLHHHPLQLKSWLEAEYAGRCEIRYSFEPEILGTGGGLRRAREHFEREDVFFLVNGDSLQFPPWAELVSSMGTTGAVASMLLRHPPLDDSFTNVWFDGIRVTAIGASGSGEALMFSGVHALTPDVFEYLPDSEFSGMTEDFYVPMLQSGERAITGVVHDGLWYDVGSPARYLQASRELTGALVRGEAGMPRGSGITGDASIGASDSRLEGQVSKSVAGRGSVVEAGAVVVDSALWDGARVGSGARIESSIIGTGVTVPADSVLANALAWISERGIVAVPIDPNQPMETAGL